MARSGQWSVADESRRWRDTELNRSYVEQPHSTNIDNREHVSLALSYRYSRMESSFVIASVA
jgi:hypothetical protein